TQKMEQLDVIGIVLRLCLMNALMTHWSHAASIPKIQYQNMMGGQGLYNASDDVVILNATNFKANVYGSSKSWLVEFYNSWCGFCYRFAPTWKSLASDILFSKRCIWNFSELIYVTFLPREGNAVTVCPTDCRNVEVTDAWKTISSNVKYFFLIFETADSNLGAEVILDLHRISSLQIRRVTTDNELLCVMSKVTKFPTVIAFGRNESQKVVSVRVPTREGIRRAIKDYAVARGVNIDEADATVSHDVVEDTEDAQQTPPAVETRKKEEEEQKKDQSSKDDQSSRKTDDYLYQLDLESALRYSINHEIPLTKVIDGEKMEALRRYLTLLAEYYPLRRGNAYLDVIRDIVEKRSRITGKEFSQLVKTTEEEMSPVYSGPPRRWVGCKGSTSSYRGYPCGLWTMFHTLSVNFALKQSKHTSQDPSAVLRAMHGYIGNFFGCADCAAHFVKTASENRYLDVRREDEAVLWLWRVHNQVNARLSGDDTEDPEHKKLQYPAAENCPACRFANGSWNEDEVLRYLKTKYSVDAIKYDGIDGYGDDDNDDGALNGNDSKVRPERRAKELKRITGFGWDLNVFDLSICVVWYITSLAIIVLVCVKFAVKRTYKKKSHMNPLSKV
ncbi:hypothetical protein DMN91_000895, partial [Ooceraea biroi]